MKEQFKEKMFQRKSLVLIEECNAIVSAYMGQGLRLTLRQLYYQLVSRNIIPNEERAYKNLSNLVSDGRLCGEIDWDAIEDRIRIPVIPSEWANIGELVESALYAYRLPRWEDQDSYVELWVEKDALAGVLKPIAHQYHITLMVNRGYSSQSAMYEAFQRLLNKNGRQREILYLGDFDPSGEDMVRDIQDRLDLFGANTFVYKIALTLGQVRKYNPPPNPAKHTDPRSRDFIARYGASSWEVDAIEPVELRKIIISEIETRVDMDLMKKIEAREEEDKNSLRDAVKKIIDK